MKRSIVCLLAAVLCLTCAALAEDAVYWTRNADFYYHANANCRGEDGMVPISAEAAGAFGKGVCPVCVPVKDAGGDVQAAVRGGTIVVRFSDAWLNEAELTGVFGWHSGDIYSGREAMDVLAENLHGDAYNSFMAEYAQHGSAQNYAYTPHILSADGLLVMNKRHIGANWYIVVRPQEKFEDRWNMYWRVSGLNLNLQDDGILYVDFDQQSVEEIRELEITRMHGSDPIYQRTTDALDLAVYAALDGNVAVIREKKLNGRSTENVQLKISGAPNDMDIAGYSEGEGAVYCCMLTDAELEALSNNARIEIRHIEHVNSQIYRVAGEDSYGYYSNEEDELLFTMNRYSGVDPVDSDFRLIFSGASDPACFVKQTELEDRLMDFTGAHIEVAVQGMAELIAERITPLVWKGEKGVLLAESHSGKDYSVGEKIITQGVDFGVEYPLADAQERSDYVCWLIDQNGNALTEPQFHESVSFREDGAVILKSVYEGEDFGLHCDFLADND